MLGESVLLLRERSLEDTRALRGPTRATKEEEEEDAKDRESWLMGRGGVVLQEKAD